MKHNPSVIVLVFILIFFVGCKKTYERVSSCSTAITINKPLEIRMYESLGTDARSLKLSCYTKDWMPCIEFKLAACTEKIGNNISIVFDSIYLPTPVCYDMIAKAGTVVDLGVQSSNNYNFTFNTNNKQYSGKLIVTDTNYSVAFTGMDDDIDFVFDTLHKMPQHTIWGEISYFDEKDSVLAKKTIADLKFLGAVDSLYAPANYGHFQIDQQHKISLWNVDALNYPRDFIFKYYGDTLTLKNFVESYGTTGSDYFQVKIYTSEGQVFRNF